jgi:anthranilate synthase/aminodeoxychorismate synthase-like glutamine amidotransferase
MLGADVTVVRSDGAGLTSQTVRAAEGVVIGPGPGRPRAAGRTLDAVGWALDGGRPLLGVCLGAQAIGEYFGGRIDHAPRLMHGKVSTIDHDGTGLFAGLPAPFAATRYHSLCLSAATLPAVLRVNASSEDGVIQGVVHRALPIHGVQFHPESVLTPEGLRICDNFLRTIAG